MLPMVYWYGIPPLIGDPGLVFTPENFSTLLNRLNTNKWFFLKTKTAVMTVTGKYRKSKF